MRKLSLWIILFVMAATVTSAQELTPKWEELTASDWEEALIKSDSTCILPLGILEKHGPHAPMGSDMIVARNIALEAARKEYAVVFPEFYFGQIYEAKHLGGTFALPSELVWELLKETADEIARNGFNKIVLVNGHGGNNNLLPYFVQSQLESKKDYVTYLFTPRPDSAHRARVNTMRKSDPSTDMHAGEWETSILMHLRPDLVRLERADDESGADRARLDLPGTLYTGIWWYARFPGHYAGKGASATAELGKIVFDYGVNALAETLRFVKNDNKTPAVQKEFFERVEAGKGE